MAIAEEIIGTHYRYPDYFEVDREKIREFARAVKDDHRAHHDEEAAKESGYDGLIASLTRIVCAGAVPDDLRRRTEACARVNAALFAQTRPGATGGSPGCRSAPPWAREAPAGAGAPPPRGRAARR